MALDEGKGWIALGVGIVVAALGVIPLLAELGVLGFSLPEFILKLIPTIALWLIVGIALYLFIDSFMEDDTLRVISIIVAVIIIAIGIIELLHQFDVIGFGIPLLGPIAYYIIFIVEGLFLVIAAFAMQ